MVHAVACRIESAQKTAEGFTVAIQLLKPRHVLHENKIRTATLHKTCEVCKQRYALIVIQLRPLRVLLGIGLTRCTTGEHHGIRSFRLHPAPDRVDTRIPDVRRLEVGIREVGFEARLGVHIVVQGKRNLHAGSTQTAACTATTREKIVYPNRHQVTTAMHVRPSNPRPVCLPCTSMIPAGLIPNGVCRCVHSLLCGWPFHSASRQGLFSF